VYSEAGEGSDGAILMVRELVGTDPDKYFYPDQYSNPANPRAHYEGTAVEILAQTSGRNHALSSPASGPQAPSSGPRGG